MVSKCDLKTIAFATKILNRGYIEEAAVRFSKLPKASRQKGLKQCGKKFAELLSREYDDDEIVTRYYKFIAQYDVPIDKTSILNIFKKKICYASYAHEDFYENSRHYVTYSYKTVIEAAQSSLEENDTAMCLEIILRGRKLLKPVQLLASEKKLLIKVAMIAIRNGDCDLLKDSYCAAKSKVPIADAILCGRNSLNNIQRTLKSLLKNSPYFRSSTLYNLPCYLDSAISMLNYSKTALPRKTLAKILSLAIASSGIRMYASW